MCEAAPRTCTGTRQLLLSDQLLPVPQRALHARERARPALASAAAADEEQDAEETEEEAEEEEEEKTAKVSAVQRRVGLNGARKKVKTLSAYSRALQYPGTVVLPRSALDPPRCARCMFSSPLSLLCRQACFGRWEKL